MNPETEDVPPVVAPPCSPFWQCNYASVYAGDCLNVLRSLPSQSVDAVVTDPPYSSGGLMRADRNKKTSEKYTLPNTLNKHPEFFGDNRDQRSFLAWATMWLSECFRVTKEGGVLMCFTDWRQLPIMTDAIQCGGYVWRGIVPWDKTEGVRPQMGWFRAQCEYILVASRGSMGQEQTRDVKVCQPGIFRENVRAHEKQHITGKPLALMKRLMEVLPQRAIVLDPFAGSGTTALACKQMNLKSISIEMSAEYCQRIKDRLSQEVLALFNSANYDEHDDDCPSSGGLVKKSYREADGDLA
jgi:site-specific DNA-methyltransferase (adenine-specific)